MVQFGKIYVPSQYMYETYGADTHKRRQHAAVIRQDGDTYTFAVVNGVGNFIGPRTVFKVPKFASARGLPYKTALNGGEVVSSLLITIINGYPYVVGYDLIRLLNNELARVYRQVDLQVDTSRRGELFTGYVGHVRVTESEVIVTSVGDCYVAINGKLVAGVEKAVDVFNGRLVREVAEFYQIDQQTAYQGIMPFVYAEQFALQNEPSKQNWYPAIDGTETPKEGISVLTYPRSEVETIVLWTDGFTARTRDNVRSLDDLESTDPYYNERTAIVVTHLNE